MKIKTIHLRNFKRFTNLLIKDIPQSARLIVVVGPNGCGKSSLFEAFNQWYRGRAGFGYLSDEKYYRKDITSAFDWGRSVVVETHEGNQPQKGSLYIRTAHRNDPDFNVGNVQRTGKASDENRLSRVIENDQTVSKNYQRLIYQTMSEVYNSENDNKSVRELRNELIGGIRQSMSNVFGDLLINNISDPLGSGSFYFEKGTVKNYHYKNLSAGEKAAFDLLLDIHVKKEDFKEAIYCIDEIETHLHTAVQGKLLAELASLVPEHSQLWITSHSLGVIRAAQRLSQESPGAACILDFSSVDPDVENELSPSSFGRVGLEKVLSVALDDLVLQLVPDTVFLCEGSRIGNRRRDFDAEVYNMVFRHHPSNAVFVSGGSANEVKRLSIATAGILRSIAPACKVVPVCDRDDRSPQEVEEYQRSGGKVLSKRNIESYLLDDSVITKLCECENALDKVAEAQQVKRDALANSRARGNPEDDLKSAAGDIYVGLKKLLNLSQCGNNSDSFMRDTMAPLITPNMEVYGELKELLFG